MQIEDLSPAPNARPFPADAYGSLDTEPGEAEARADGSPVPVPPRPPLWAFAERRPRREASRRLPETISAR